MNNALKMIGLFGFLFIGLTNCSKLEEIGITVTEDFAVSEFSKLDLITSGQITIQQGTPNLTVEADQAIVEALEVNVENGTLKIRLDKRYQIVDEDIDLHFFINTPSLEGLKIRGESTISVEDNFDYDRLELELDGDHRFSASGTAQYLSLSTKGQNEFNCFGLMSDDVKIKTLGESYIEVSCEEHLDVNLLGAGEVRYKGYPNIDKTILGEIRLIDAN